MTDHKLTDKQEARFDEWNWRSNSSFGKIKSSAEIRELKILLAKEIQMAVEVERNINIKTLETVLMLLNGDSNQVDVVKNYCLNKLKIFIETATTEEEL